MQIFIVDGGAPTAVYEDRGQDASDAALYDFTCSYGTEAADRYTVVCVTFEDAPSSIAIDFIKVSGSNATQIVSNTRTTGVSTMNTSIWAIHNPTGTSGTVRVDLDEIARSCAVVVFSVTGWAGANSVTDFSNGDPASLSATVPAYSTVIACASATNTTPGSHSVGATWTGLTERSDVNYDGANTGFSSASLEFTTAQSPLTAECTLSHLGNHSAVLACFYN